MTWTISFSGSRTSALEHIERETTRQVDLGYMTEQQGKALKTLVEAMPGNMVSINASGHNATTSTSCSISVSVYEQAEVVKAAPAETAQVPGPGVVGVSDVQMGKVE